MNLQLFTAKKNPSKKALTAIISGTILTGLTALPAHAATVFINEIHYDNAGSDLNEGVEILAEANTNLDGWSIQFYNGDNGSIYRMNRLNGIVSDFGNGFGVLEFLIAGIQNGPADAIALVNDLGELVDFISYEGVVTGTEGPALGITSVDIGIAEDGATMQNWSIQRVGVGDAASLDASDFGWIKQQYSFGEFNVGQTITTSTVPIPAASWLFGSALIGLYGNSRYRRSKRL